MTTCYKVVTRFQDRLFSYNTGNAQLSEYIQTRGRGIRNFQHINIYLVKEYRPGHWTLKRTPLNEKDPIAGRLFITNDLATAAGMCKYRDDCEIWECEARNPVMVDCSQNFLIADAVKLIKQVK